MPKILSTKARRRNMIAQRASLVEHLASRDDDGQLVREMSEDDDLEERRSIQHEAKERAARF